MNVMLANIAEQTREIGLRMAVGAAKIRIVVYVLWHSVLLSLFGAIWGLMLGVFTAYAIQVFFSWEIAFSLIGVFAGPLAAVISGVLFGLHPALRAASLDPAIALRDS
jgi:ABC-type antimicrobial peptide transport system permease subunit